MVGVESHEVRFQCPKCGHDLKQTIGRLKANEHMTCPGCGIGINIDTNRLANASRGGGRDARRLGAHLYFGICQDRVPR